MDEIPEEVCIGMRQCDPCGIYPGGTRATLFHMWRGCEEESLLRAIFDEPLGLYGILALLKGIMHGRWYTVKVALKSRVI